MSILSNFHGQDPGDETRRYGDYYYRTAGEAIDAGDAVTVGSDGQVYKQANGNGGQNFGVAYIDAAAGDDVTVKTNGGVIAKVDSVTDADADGNLDTVAGTTVGSGTGGNAGELAAGGDEYLILEVETADGSRYAEISKK